MGEKNGHYCVSGEMWNIEGDGYPTLIHEPSTLNIVKAFIELFRDSDMRPEDECHVLYESAEIAAGKETAAERDHLRAVNAELLEALQFYADEDYIEWVTKGSPDEDCYEDVDHGSRARAAILRARG